MKPFLSGMPMHEYNEVTAIRSTEITMLAQGFTEAHVKARRLDPILATPAMILGTVVHGIVSGNEQDFAVLKLDGRTKAGKEEKATALEANPHAALVKEPDYGMAKFMAESILKNEQAKALIEDGVLEGSFFWEESGQQFKSRPDVMNDAIAAIADIKTAREAHYDGFLKAVKYGHYDLQAYTQVHAANTATDRMIEDFYWIVVEKEPPYMTVVFPFEMTSRTENTWEVFAYRLMNAQCTDKWPGYPTVGHEITEDLLY